jgi:hypothetical protein
VAGLCEPALLKQPQHARSVLDLLASITHAIQTVEDRRSDGFIALRKALAYGWSVAVVAEPDYGWPMLQNLLTHPDKDIQWIGRENMKKNRLKKLTVGSKPVVSADQSATTLLNENNPLPH